MEYRFKHIDNTAYIRLLLELENSVLYQRRCSDDRNYQDKNITQQIVGCLARPERQVRCAEHTSEVGDSTGHTHTVKDDKADKDCYSYVNVREKSGKLCEKLVENKFFKDEEYCKIKSPNDKRPVCTVPEAC